MSIKVEYGELRDKVAELLDKCADVTAGVVPQLGVDEENGLPRTFKDRAHAVRNEEFVVVVVGEMNRGKSTLLNAMMCKQLLTMDVLECTATVNFLRYPREDQSPEYVEVHFAEGQATDEGESTKRIPADKLADYTSRLSELGKDEVSERVDHVDVFVESNFLRQNVLLVDTPGTNTTTPNHLRITEEQITRSNAAIFLFDAETQMTRSDQRFLADHVERAVARLFFVVNKIDKVPEKDVERVLARVEENIAKAINYRDRSEVFAVSGAKALLGRTGYSETPILTKGAGDVLENSSFPQKMVEESGICALEQKLEQYLFQGRRAYDLLQVPLNSIVRDTSRLIDMLRRQQDVSDGALELRELAQKVESQQRLVDGQKRELKGKAGKLTGELDEVMEKCKERVREKGGQFEEEMKDQLTEHQTYSDLKDNWRDGDHLIDLPGRKLAKLGFDVEQDMKTSVGRVLRKWSREIEEQVGEALKDVSFKLVQVREEGFRLRTHGIDPTKLEKLEEDERSIDGELKKARYDALEAGAEVREAQSAVEAIDRSIHEAKDSHRLKSNRLGDRPSPVEVREEKFDPQERGGFIGTVLDWVFWRKPDIKRPTVSLDYEMVERHAVELAELDKRHDDASKQLTRKKEEALEKLRDAEIRKRLREHAEKIEADRLEERRKQKEKVQRDYVEASNSATKVAKNQLIRAFQDGRYALEKEVAKYVSQAEEVATKFVDSNMARLDASLKSDEEELARLRSLKEERGREARVTKERIQSALAELGCVQESAKQLLDSLRAFSGDF